MPSSQATLTPFATLHSSRLLHRQGWSIESQHKVKAAVLIPPTVQTITNGQQLQGGSCNPIPIGDIPAKSNTPSVRITNPACVIPFWPLSRA
jgi:hypothetical protein